MVVTFADATVYDGEPDEEEGSEMRDRRLPTRKLYSGKILLGDLDDRTYDAFGHRSWVNRRKDEFWDAVAAASMHDAERVGFEELYYGEAFSLMRPSSYVHVPRNLKDGQLEPDFIEATLKYERKFDKFPGATCVYPMSKYQWHEKLAGWALYAGLEVTSKLSALQICIAFWQEDAYVAVPVWTRIAFIALFAAGVSIEIYSSWADVYEADNCWMRRVYARHGCFSYIRAYLCAIFLRVLSIPTKLEDASMFFSPPRACSSHVRRDCVGFNISDIPDIPAWVSESRAADGYADRRGYVVKVPRIIIQDWLLFLLTAYIVSFNMERNTVVTMVQLGVSGLGVLTSVISAYMYGRYLLRYRLYLVTMMRQGDPFESAKSRMETLRSNCARRVLLKCFPVYKMLLERSEKRMAEAL